MTRNLKDEYNVYVDSVEEAVTLAKIWQQEKKFDYFRGQAQDWDVYATIHRGGEKIYQEGLERLKMLYSFMQQNSILKEYINNIDHFIAVAQHYGLATNYVDFTTDPNVAAYFATNSIHNVQGEYACIICINHDDFNKNMDFSSPIFAKYLNKEILKPCFLNYNVKNLWRLQAHKGRIL